MTDTLLGGRYRLDHLIGRGGMAAVWSATDTVLDRPVAIKRLHAGLLADAEHAERFRREAVLVARLSHPNLVRLLDRGEDADGPYLVMELVDGENLRARIRREGSLDPDEAARICAEVGRALSYAHGQGVVHRDIKAQNVLLTAEGGVKLADFGIARLIETEGEPGLTKTDMLLGSADYLSPEQADGRPLDARTDIYSLGILLYECLTGVLPFRGEGFVAVAMKHCSEPMPDPRVLAPGGPRVARGVHAARDGEGALRALPGRRPDGRGPRGPGPGHRRDAGRALVPDDSDEDTARRRRPRRRRWVAAVAVALVVLLAAGALGAFLLLPGDDAAPPEVASVPLTISAVRDYDPQGNDQAENPAERGYAVDARPRDRLVHRALPRHPRVRRRSRAAWGWCCA